MKFSTFARVNLFMGILLVFPGATLAKPSLDHAVPKVESEIDVPPTEIKVWFSDEIDPMFSTLEVDDCQGKQVDDGDTHQDPNDKKELIISIPTRIYNGDYTVVWKINTLGSKQNQGKFKFTINIKD